LFGVPSYDKRLCERGIRRFNDGNVATASAFARAINSEEVERGLKHNYRLVGQSSCVSLAALMGYVVLRYGDEQIQFEDLKSRELPSVLEVHDPATGEIAHRFQLSPDAPNWDYEEINAG
jgi:hypothetical protein